MVKLQQHGAITNVDSGIIPKLPTREQIQRDVLAHEVKIKEAERQLEELREEGRKLKEHLNDSSPFLSLPVDVISEIFYHSYDWRYRYDYARLPVQFVIGRTCRAWREIAWSQSRLWQDVTISLADSRFDDQLRLLEKWLDRSAGRLISLTLNLHPDSVKKTWTPPPALYHTILQTCHRWKSVGIYDGMFDGLISTMNSCGVAFQFPELERLYTGESTQYFAEWPLNFPSQLRELHLSVAETLEFPNISVDWSQLTSLYVSCAVEPLLDVIRQCRSLVYLNFNCPDNTDDDDIDSQIVENPHNLPSLDRISYLGESYWLSQLMRNITAPNLQYLSSIMEPEEAIPGLWVANAIRMVKRSNCKLKHFSIIVNFPSLSFVEQDFMDLLNALPYLEAINIDFGPTLTNRSIDLLTPETDSSSAAGVKSTVPNLRNFRFHGDVSFDPQNFVDMVESRSRLIQASSTADASSKADISVPKRLELDIHCHNRHWLDGKSPTEADTFYDHLRSFSSNVVVNIDGP
ncbi:hypothetical protein JR316_0013059 [Psilocybe cubensis]|uniref:Uncharacterized protein n=2 Tax=Psilocybe cubensis TaxID=181762 RepID=A0ACB8GGB9_PSICU|nr:hypothetical protein JR316_0013059 [Psilocybe cubensis]KAH9474597.1 hypothetical protein JR316_0013059 [Psilocybe cubensis]